MKPRAATARARLPAGGTHPAPSADRLLLPYWQHGVDQPEPGGAEGSSSVASCHPPVGDTGRTVAHDAGVHREGAPPAHVRCGRAARPCAGQSSHRSGRGRKDHPSRAGGGGPMTDCFMRQRDAAHLLGVSVSYLRASSCPKRLLPSNGRGSKPLVRYLRSEVLGWALARRE